MGSHIIIAVDFPATISLVVTGVSNDEGEQTKFHLDGYMVHTKTTIVDGLVEVLGEGVAGFPHQQAGAVDPFGVDILPEINMKLFGEKVGQVGDADAQGVRHAGECDFVVCVLIHIPHDPMAEAAVTEIVDGMVGEGVQRAGKEEGKDGA